MLKENEPKVSVVIPHFNQSHLIPNAVNSILNQTIQDFEIIIVDDGSEKEHFSKLEELLRKLSDNRVKLIPRPHEGLVATRNKGNEYARADIIAIQDADDLSLPNRLERCLKEIEAGADVVIHDGYTNFWDIRLDCIARGYIKNPSFNKYRLLQGQCYTGWPIFRKEVWEKKSFRMETQFMYDWAMLLDWAFSGFKFKIVNEGLYEYVRHQDSASIIFERDGRRQRSKEAIIKIMKDEYGQTIS